MPTGSRLRRPRAGVALVLLAVSTVATIATALPAAAASFTNAAVITIPDATCGGAPGTATPYPSTIVVSGLTGTVSDVNVVLNGLTHSFEGDPEVLLVGPAGGAQNLELLSDAGTGALSGATVTFDDAAAAPAPQNVAWGGGAGAATTIKPTNYTELSGADTFPAPAPAPSATTTLASAFNGIVANGTWSLYVIDDACGDPPGSISGGWTLEITTAAAAAPTTTGIGSSLNPSGTGQAVTFTATVTSGGTAVPAGTVTFSEGPTTLAAGVAVNGSGQASFTTSALVEGDHLISATYNGTAAFGTSSGSVDQRVDNPTTVVGNTYCNAGPLTIPTNGPASPYPSNIVVTGFSGTLATATVELNNVTHAFAEDIDVLLVGPSPGDNLLLVSDAGNGSAPTSNVSVTFDDTAAGSVPATGAWGPSGSSVSLRPTDYPGGVSDVDSFPAPAPTTFSRPATAGAATLQSSFADSTANGTWSLYLVDDSGGDAGSIAGGWCVTMVPKATTAITTTASGSVTLGSPITDSATLSGGVNPTGTITFTLYGPDDATCAGSALYTAAVPVAGNGAYGAGNFTPTAAGTYRWIASYGGDADDSAVTGACNDPGETAQVSPVSTILSTAATATADVSTPIADTATLSGGVNPTGTITFSLYGPDDATCGTPAVFTAVVPVVGNGAYSSGNFSPTAAGTYRWVASYSGDANNSAETGACTTAGEVSAVARVTPVLAAAATPANVPLGSALRASATLTGGFNPTGTVTFGLYAPGNTTCSGVAVFTSSMPVAGGGATSGPFTPTVTGTYRWLATYSGDAANNGVITSCNATNQTVVAVAVSPDRGYRLVAEDGGIFAFGDAAFFGSTGDLRLNLPIVGMAATPTGRGYWLVAADGGIFAFGDAGFFGSAGDLRLNSPVVGITATPSGKGYLFGAADGAVLVFGDAEFLGSVGAAPLSRKIVGIAGLR